MRSILGRASHASPAFSCQGTGYARLGAFGGGRWEREYPVLGTITTQSRYRYRLARMGPTRSISRLDIDPVGGIYSASILHIKQTGGQFGRRLASRARAQRDYSGPSGLAAGRLVRNPGQGDMRLSSLPLPRPSTLRLPLLLPHILQETVTNPSNCAIRPPSVAICGTLWYYRVFGGFSARGSLCGLLAIGMGWSGDMASSCGRDSPAQRGSLSAAGIWAVRGQALKGGGMPGFVLSTTSHWRGRPRLRNGCS